MRRILVCVLVLLVSHAARSGGPIFRLAPLFTDNMVLQQKSTVPVWGKGTPGSRIVLVASWKKQADALVGPDGSWSLTLATPHAGGPFQIEIRHDDTTRVLKNVLVGEVWLCSGQSNMEMPLEGWPPDSILWAKGEIASSSNPSIRLFTVKRAYSPTREWDCAGRWEECSSLSSPSFSATAYFFGKKLQQELNVPIGLIHSSWGGTPIEAWTSGEFLSRVAEFDTIVRKIRASADSMKLLQAWLDRFPVIDISTRERATKWQHLELQDEQCARRIYADSTWPLMHLPTYWERTGIGEFDGVVWFRRQITIPASWVHKDLILELGPIDDMDVSFVNGQEVGSHETEGLWRVDRVYPIPGQIVDSTTLSIAVRVLDTGGGGGIYGPVSSMSVHPKGSEERVSLGGDWRFLPVADYRGDKLYVFGATGEVFSTRPKLPLDFTPYVSTALFNGMIAPLLPYSLAGVIWYQGEANAGAPELYRRLFPLMIENWRSAFHSADLPFYFVQIAPYSYDATTESQYLRESQFLTLAVKNTGMAVTMDIGNVRNIHPANKQEVGRRLALWALAKQYGKKLSYSGPLYRSSKKFRDRIELFFDNAAGGLVVTQTESGNGFLIAGADSVFRPAEVRVRGNRLIVSQSALTNPRAVRYAFSNTAQATLFNADGLPSPSFRTDDWSR